MINSESNIYCRGCNDEINELYLFVFDWFFCCINCTGIAAADVEIEQFQVILYFNKDSKGAEYGLELATALNSGLWDDAADRITLTLSKDGVKNYCVAPADEVSFANLKTFNVCKGNFI